MMEFRIARAARVTGEMLERLVREQLQLKNITELDVVVCYGTGYAGTKPVLNARCSSGDKMQQGQALYTHLQGETLDIVPIEAAISGAERNKVTTFPSPWIARRRKHSQGRDIRVCKTLKGLRAAARNHDFVTPFVESDTEYRVWAYRNRILAVYEKRLTEPELNTGFGRNRSKGWTFHALQSNAIPDSLRTVTRRALEALGLDFGAVDVLGKRNADGSTTCCVLEVNSAPGVSDERRTALVKLVHRIVRWCTNGCPAREV